MGDVVTLDDFREEPVVIFRVTISSDGRISTDLNSDHLETIEQVNWAISAAQMGMAELLDLKRDLLREEGL